VRSLRSEDRRWRRRIATDGKKCIVREVNPRLRNVGVNVGVSKSARRGHRNWRRPIKLRGTRRRVENSGRSGQISRKGLRNLVVDGVTRSSWWCWRYPGWCVRVELGRRRNGREGDGSRGNLRNVVSDWVVRSRIIVVGITLSFQPFLFRLVATSRHQYCEYRRDWLYLDSAHQSPRNVASVGKSCNLTAEYVGVNVSACPFKVESQVRSPWVFPGIVVESNVHSTIARFRGELRPLVGVVLTACEVKWSRFAQLPSFAKNREKGGYPVHWA